MSLAVYTYSPSDVNIIISGHKVSGWNSVSVQHLAPTFKVIRGIRGKNTRVRNTDTSASVTIAIDQNSVSNSVLESVAMQDAATGNGRLSILISDPNGSGMFYSDTAFIEATPNYTLEGEANDRGWIFHCLSSQSGGDGGKLGGLVGSVLSAIF